MKRTGKHKPTLRATAAAVLTVGALTYGPTAAAAPAPACTAAQLSTEGAQRIGSAQVRITVVNEGPSCLLRGFPTVAVAGLGSPARNSPLSVVPQGAAQSVALAPGGQASTLLTFTPVLGEGDGSCASGAEPTVAPSLVIGVAGGHFQLAPDDGGDFALCGETVRATAFR
ncbi:DUF4232 domain-containing protein [Streptomyces sp. NBC_00249]|uniref:DUF4232 domain-containing protein n=1 Tax=Streptomyces sp. NBC_00249 TaxID=2975690 RepID=UPI00224F7A63|nr:DUF4232 domain-containing protein [Streptomyces sp. NBC_00249]MCX5197824.1 DUF4232 domain-containing protein [Streptomyces sp. NBC_00249]